MNEPKLSDLILKLKKLTGMGWPPLAEIIKAEGCHVGWRSLHNYCNPKLSVTPHANTVMLLRGALERLIEVNTR